MDTITKNITQLDGCVHLFDYICIHEWSKVTNLCPLCKQPFTKLIKKEVNEHPRKPFEKISLFNGIFHELFFVIKNTLENTLTSIVDTNIKASEVYSKT